MFYLFLSSGQFLFSTLIHLGLGVECVWLGGAAQRWGSEWRGEGPNRFGQCRDLGVCVKSDSLVNVRRFFHAVSDLLHCVEHFRVGVHTRFRCSSHWLSCVSLAVVFFPFLLFSLHRIMGKSIRLCSFVKLLWILTCVVVVSGRPRIVSRHHSSGITDLI